MTREEAIKELAMLMKDTCGAKYSALRFAICALKQKENEPASSKGNTSSENQKDYICKNNDSTKISKSQEAINSALDALDGIYCDLSDKEQNIWNLGVTYERLLDAQQNEEDER